MKPSKLASRLALARAVTGLIQTELAAMTGVSLNQIKHLENGDYEMSVRYAWVFSQELGVSSQWLIGVGSPDVPIGLDGQEFTQKQFIQARAYHSEKDKSGISKHVLHHMSEEEIESARTAFKNLLYD